MRLNLSQKNSNKLNFYINYIFEILVTYRSDVFHNFLWCIIIQTFDSSNSNYAMGKFTYNDTLKCAQKLVHLPLSTPIFARMSSFFINKHFLHVKRKPKITLVNLIFTETHLSMFSGAERQLWCVTHKYVTL